MLHVFYSHQNHKKLFKNGGNFPKGQKIKTLPDIE